jgi:hypothetical protein
MQTVKDMDTAKIAISNQDASNAEVTTSQTSATEMEALLISNVSSVVEIFLRITRGIWSTKENVPTSPFDSSCKKQKKPYSLN